MIAKALFVSVVGVCLALGSVADAQEKKRKTGNITGKLVSQKASPNGKNTIIEVLAPGEEKARTYRVQYDPKIKAPLAPVLAAVRAAKVGDVVQFEWIDTGEGLAITAFQVLNKGEDKK